MLTCCAILRYARSRSLPNSSGGTSTVSLTMCLSVSSTVVCIRVRIVAGTTQVAGSLAPVHGSEHATRHGGSERRCSRKSSRSRTSLPTRRAAIALAFFGGTFEVKFKADRSPVTEADLAIETMIREAVHERYPDDGVLGEEGGIGGRRKPALDRRPDRRDEELRRRRPDLVDPDRARGRRRAGGGRREPAGARRALRPRRAGPGRA